MLELTNRITINGNIVFNFVNEVDKYTSWQNLTDRCRITVPRKFSFQGKPITIGKGALFQRGQSVKVELGYDGNLITRFTGYISKIEPRLPLVFECEDEMYLLKKNRLGAAYYPSANLSQILKFCIPSTTAYLATLEQNLGKFRIYKDATTTDVLNLLREKYSIYSFFRNGTLYIGLPYVVSLRKNHVFHFEQNIIDSNLEYREDSDTPIRVHGISIDDNNNRIEYFYPSKQTSGQNKTLTKSNYTMAALQQEVKRFYDTFQYTGFRGGFTTFGAPAVNHGDAIQFLSNVLPEYNSGSYLVKAIRETFGMNGYRQVIEMANQILV